MTSLDEQLRDAFREAGPPSHELTGDVAQVHRRVRRRRARRWAVEGALVAVAAVGGLLVVRDGSDGGHVLVEEPPASSATSGSSTTEPTASTPPEPPATTAADSSTSSSSSSSSSTTSVPQSSLTREQLESATYPAPCPTYDTRPVTLTGGRAMVPLGPGAELYVELSDVAFGDGDADGQPDAAVLLHCAFAGADADTGAWAGVYRTGADGQLEPVGSPLVLAHSQSLAMEDGYRARVAVDRYDADDPACCPSASVNQVWRFDGSSFRLESETPP